MNDSKIKASPIHLVLAVIVGFGFSVHAYNAISSGKIFGKGGGSIYMDTSPVYFWFSVIFPLVIVILAIVVTIVRLKRQGIKSPNKGSHAD